MTWRHYEAHHHGYTEKNTPESRPSTKTPGYFVRGFIGKLTDLFFFRWVDSPAPWIESFNCMVHMGFSYMNPSQETSKNMKRPRVTSIRPGQQSKLFQWSELHSWELIFLSKIRDFAQSRALNRTRRWQLWLGGGNSNIFYVHPDPWGNDPIWRAYFSIGLKPPTSWLFRGCPICSLLKDHL